MKQAEEIDDEVARSLGREFFTKKNMTLAIGRQMLETYRKKNRLAIEAPSLYSMIRLLVGRTGPITKQTRAKLVALFEKLDHLET